MVSVQIPVILQMFGQPEHKNAVLDKVNECNLVVEKYVPTKRATPIVGADTVISGGSFSCM